MKYIVAMFVCLFSIQVHAKTVAVLIVSNDKKIDQELLDDTAESIMFRIAKELKLKILPKERLKGLINYVKPRKPGMCFVGDGNSFMSSKCLQEALNKTDAAFGIVVRVVRFKGTHRLEMHTIPRGKRQPTYQTTKYTVDVMQIRSFIDACTLLIMDEVVQLNKPRFRRIVRRIEYKPKRHQRKVIDWGSIAVPTITTSYKPYYTWGAVGSGTLTAGFTIAAIVIGMQAKDAEAEIHRCANEPCPDLQGSARDKFIADGESKTTTTNVMIGLASTFAVTTAVLAVLSAYEDDNVQTVPSVSVTPVAKGVMLQTNWKF